MGERVLITGGAGFIGSHLASRLVSDGYEVVVADIVPTDGTLLALAGALKSVTYLPVDVTDRASVRDMMLSAQVDIVFHLAAQPISVLSNRFPAETIRINVEGTRNVCWAADSAGVRGFILASSACRYGVPLPGTSPLREDDPAQPGFYSYSTSKEQAERAIVPYELPRIVARFVNVYGPGDRHFSRIVPKLFRSFVEGDETIHLTRGKGDTVLDYLFVDDAVEALVAARAHLATIRPGRAAEVFNFGVSGEHPLSVKQLAEIASMAFDGRQRRVQCPAEAVEPSMVKYLDASKANRLLGWRARVLLPEGLAQTAAWYRAHLHELAPFDDTALPRSLAAVG